MVRRTEPWIASSQALLAMTAEKTPEVPVAVTVFIRYQLDPFKRAMFEEYARR